MAFKMKLKTDMHRTPWGVEWTAIDEDTYDGAPDGNNMMGVGSTEQEAIEDLQRLFQERAEWQEDRAMAEAERSETEHYYESEGGICFGPKP